MKKLAHKMKKGGSKTRSQNQDSAKYDSRDDDKVDETDAPAEDIYKLLRQLEFLEGEKSDLQSMVHSQKNIMEQMEKKRIETLESYGKQLEAVKQNVTAEKNFNAQLEADKASISKQVENLTEMLEQNKGILMQRDSLQEDLKKKEIQLEQMDRVNEKLREQIDELKENKVKHLNEIEKLKKEADNALDRQYETLTLSQRQELTNVKLDHSNEIQALREDLAKSNAKISKIMVELDVKTTEDKHNKEQITRLTGTIETDNQEIQLLRSKLNDAFKTIKENEMNVSLMQKQDSENRQLLETTQFLRTQLTSVETTLQQVTTSYQNEIFALEEKNKLLANDKELSEKKMADASFKLDQLMNEKFEVQRSSSKQVQDLLKTKEELTMEKLRLTMENKSNLEEEARLKNKVNDLTEHVAILNAKRDEHNNLKNKFATTKVFLKNSVEVMQVSISKLKKSIQTEKMQVVENNKVFQNFFLRLNNIQQKNAEQLKSLTRSDMLLRKQIQQLTEANKLEGHDDSALKELLDSCQREVLSLENQLYVEKAARESCEANEAKLAAKLELMGDLEKQFEATTENVTQLDATINTLKAQVINKNLEVESMQSKLDQECRHQIELSEKNKSLLEQNNDLSENNRILKNELSYSKAEQDQLLEKIHLLEYTIESASLKEASIQQQLANANATAANAQRLSEELEDLKKKFRQDKQKIEMESKSSENTTIKQNAELIEQQGEMRRLRSEYLDMLHRRDEVEAALKLEIDQLKLNYSNSQEKVASLVEQLEHLSAESDKKCQKLMAEIEFKTAELAQMHERINALEQQVKLKNESDQKNFAPEKQNELDKRTNSTSDEVTFENGFAMDQSTCLRLTQEVKKLNSSLQSKENECLALKADLKVRDNTMEKMRQDPNVCEDKEAFALDLISDVLFWGGSIPAKARHSHSTTSLCFETIDVICIRKDRVLEALFPHRKEIYHDPFSVETVENHDNFDFLGTVKSIIKFLSDLQEALHKLDPTLFLAPMVSSLFDGLGIFDAMGDETDNDSSAVDDLTKLRKRCHSLELRSQESRLMLQIEREKHANSIIRMKRQLKLQSNEQVKTSNIQKNGSSAQSLSNNKEIKNATNFIGHKSYQVNYSTQKYYQNQGRMMMPATFNQSFYHTPTIQLKNYGYMKPQHRSEIVMHNRAVVDHRRVHTADRWCGKGVIMDHSKYKHFKQPAGASYVSDEAAYMLPQTYYNSSKYSQASQSSLVKSDYGAHYDTIVSSKTKTSQNKIISLNEIFDDCVSSEEDFITASQNSEITNVTNPLYSSNIQRLDNNNLKDPIKKSKQMQNKNVTVAEAPKGFTGLEDYIPQPAVVSSDYTHNFYAIDDNKKIVTPPFLPNASNPELMNSEYFRNQVKEKVKYTQKLLDQRHLHYTKQ